jgi:hypothetical protein
LETFLVLYSSMSYACVSDQGSVNFSKPTAMLWLFSVIWSQWVNHYHHHHYYYYCHYRVIYLNTPVEHILCYAMNICQSFRFPYQNDVCVATHLNDSSHMICTWKLVSRQT